MPYSKKSGEFGISKEELRTLNAAIRADGSAINQVGGLDGLASLLQTSAEHGIRDSEAPYDARRTVFGTNEYPEPPVKSLLSIFIGSLKDPMLIALLITAVISFVIGITYSGEWYEGVAILLAVSIVSVVATVNDYDKDQKFRALNQTKKNFDVKVVRNEAQRGITNFQLMVGDVLTLSAGDVVPADGVFVAGFNVELDESQMTGESEPRAKTVHGDIFMLSGCHVQSGQGSMLVTAVGSASEYGCMLSQLCEEDEDTPLQVKLDGLAKIIGYVGVASALLTFFAKLGMWIIRRSINSQFVNWIERNAAHCTVTTSGDATVFLHQYLESGPYPGFSGSEFLTETLAAVMIAITIIVVAVPEGLPLAVTMSLAYSVQKMLKDQNLVRKLQACETMGCATTICSDKTGTLTMNAMTVVKSWVAEDDEFPASDVPSAVVENIALNSTASIALEEGNKRRVLGNPTEGALLQGLDGCPGHDHVATRRFYKGRVEQVWPFNSVTKVMATLISLDAQDVTPATTSRGVRTRKSSKTRASDATGHRLLLKGAPEIVLDYCSDYLSGTETSSLTNRKRNELLDVVHEFSKTGLRTICLAHQDFADVSTLLNADAIPNAGYVVGAIFGIKDPLRPGVPKCVAEANQAGIIVRMVTGDNLATAVHIAREAGILLPSEAATVPYVISGREFAEASPSQQKAWLMHLKVMARSTPADKYQMVKRLGSMGHVVAVTGDGTNDAPALKKADVGLSMGSGTEVAKEASDIVILDDNFESIMKSVMWGRSVYANIRRFIQFQVTVNFGALVVTFITAFSESEASPPLTALQLLWVNVIMDSFAALALATEPPSREYLKNKPQDYAILITNKMKKHILVQGLYQVFVLLGLFFLIVEPSADFDDYLEIPSAEVDKEKRLLVVRSIVFNTFVFCQWFNQFCCRMINDEMNILRGIFSAKPFCFITFIILLVQTLMIQVAGASEDFQRISQTHALSLNQWLVCLGIAFITIPLSLLTRLIPTSEDDVAQVAEEQEAGASAVHLCEELEELRAEYKTLKDKYEPNNS